MVLAVTMTRIGDASVRPVTLVLHVLSARLCDVFLDGTQDRGESIP